MKLAILQNGDTPQIESTAQQLLAAGYETRYCGPGLRNELQRIGCDTVLSVEMMYSLGYDRVAPHIQAATLEDMDRCDLFCEIKVRNVDKIRERWPRLRDRICYWRVNGAQPEICPKGGDEVNLPCPIITACLWYGTDTYRMPKVSPLDQGFVTSNNHYYQKSKASSQLAAEHEHPHNHPAKDHYPVRMGDNGMAYVMWPPYPRREEYLATDRSRTAWGRRGNAQATPAAPYCLAHSAPAWGYRQIVDDCVSLGVQIYGNNSPAGQISHRKVRQVAATALALVHLKSVDCPGWALYEAMLSGCPVVTGRLLNSRMLARDLLIHGETCLEFGVPASLEFGRGDMDFPKCVADIKEALAVLSDRGENLRIGENGRRKLLDLLWREDRDGPGFKAFCERHWG